jgi:hypothetical protein
MPKWTHSRSSRRLSVDVHLDHLDDVLHLVTELQDDRALQHEHGPRLPGGRHH